MIVYGETFKNKQKNHNGTCMSIAGASVGVTPGATLKSPREMVRATMSLHVTAHTRRIGRPIWYAIHPAASSTRNNNIYLK